MRGALRKYYQEYVAAEKEYGRLYDSNFAGMGGADKMEARNRFDKARNNFEQAIDEFDILRKRANNPQAVTSNEQSTEKAQRPPQLVTVNGDKISHGHIFQHEKTEE